MWLKRSWGGEVKNVSVLVAVGVSADGFREILGLAEGAKEDKESWKQFLRYLKNRGLKGVKLFISDKSLGLVESIADFYPEARWQRCIVHYYRNVFTLIPRGKMKEVAGMLKAIHAQEDRKEALRKAKAVSEKLQKMKLKSASELVEESIHETLNYYEFPEEHWRKIRTNNPMERILKEVRRRTKVIGAFPDGQSALMLVGARLRHVTTTKWGTVKYMNMDRLLEKDVEANLA
jgi:transposase-like protein